jgi:hypothetical protein
VGEISGTVTIELPIADEVATASAELNLVAGF